ncbi:effector-associated constant component EACC1 [Streptomyces qinglanensis]|uniref:effector-associated constant component EACC1 n=1 Tax=Streptomyces qinglanensis TaxID=943816 RepID=UPI003D7283B9
MADPELRGHATVTVRPRQSLEGQMGQGLEVINVVLANSIALGALITAIATWRSSRPRPPELTLERDGVAICVYDSSPETIERITRAWSRGSEPAPSRTDGGCE